MSAVAGSTDLGDGRVHRHPLADVAREGERAASRGTDLMKQSVEEFLPPRDDADLDPVSRQLTRQFEPDAARCSGDKRCLRLV